MAPIKIILIVSIDTSFGYEFLKTKDTLREFEARNGRKSKNSKYDVIYKTRSLDLSRERRHFHKM